MRELSRALTYSSSWIENAVSSPTGRSASVHSGNRADLARISDFARYGAIWATKNLIGKLTPEQRQRLKFGVRRKNSDGREIFVPSIFSTVESLADQAAVPIEKLKDIVRLPITEIVEIAAVLLFVPLFVSTAKMLLSLKAFVGLVW